MKELGKSCLDAKEDPIGVALRVVHPERGVPNLFDIYGNAVCVDCGALWHRHYRGGLTLVVRQRKPAKRALAANPSTLPKRKRG